MMMKPMVVCLGILWGAASPSSCESTKQVASACDGGVCPDAPRQLVDGVPCGYGDWSASIDFSYAPESGGYLSQFCLPESMPAGYVDHCTVTIEWDDAMGTGDNDDPRMRCESLGGEIRERGASPTCELSQVSDPRVSFGYHFDDNSEQVSKACRGPYPRRLALSEALTYDKSGRITASCDYASANAADVGSVEIEEGAVLVASEVCAPQQAGAEAPVGQSCTPQVRRAGYSAADVVIEPSNPECGAGVCLVYQLEGAIPENGQCEAELCADPKTVEDRVYCSCRCGADEPGDLPLCDCPAGFICEEVAQHGSVAGSYCVNAHIEN